MKHPPCILRRTSAHRDNNMCLLIPILKNSDRLKMVPEYMVRDMNVFDMRSLSRIATVLATSSAYEVTDASV
eukprot:8583290-Alexandrium_andersonii.AAC.1